MNICKKCGHVFTDDEICHSSVSVAPFWGFPAEENVGTCPNCGSDDICEAIQCAKCGEYEDAEWMTFDICEKCLDKVRGDYNACKRYSEGETKPVEINALALAILGDEKDINAILFEFIEKRGVPVADGCSDFVDEYSYDIAEKMGEEVEK